MAKKKRVLKSRAGKNRVDRRHTLESDLRVESNVLDTIRQWRFPKEFRIAALDAVFDLQEEDADAPTTAGNVPPRTGAPTATVDAPPAEEVSAAADASTAGRFLAEMATCLWYLKTKHFKRDWDDDGTQAHGDDDDPRIRRAMSRLNRGIDALKRSGIEVYDPTNKRYPQGGEGMMRPIQFEPRAGLTVEIVTDTVAPVVFCGNRLIQRGEVFVAVPKEERAPATRPSAPGSGAGDADGQEDPPSQTASEEAKDAVSHLPSAATEDKPSEPQDAASPLTPGPEKAETSEREPDAERPKTVAPSDVPAGE